MNAILVADDHRDLRDPYGLNDLKDQALRFVLEDYVRKSDIFIHAADITDRRLNDSELVARLTAIYGSCFYKHVDWFWLVGNHCGTNRRISPMTPFVDGVSAFGGKAQVVGCDAVEFGNIQMQGWNSNVSIPESKCEIFVGHCRVKEWSKTTEKALSLGELQSLSQRLLLIGDTHQSYESGKVISIGSLAPKDFSDANIEAGFIVLDTETLQYRRIKIPNYPIFRKLVVTPETAEPEASWVKGNIVRLDFRGPQKWMTDSLKKKWQLTLLAMQPRQLVIGDDFYIGETKQQQSDSRLPVEERYETFATEQRLWDNNVVEIGRKAMQ